MGGVKCRLVASHLDLQLITLGEVAAEHRADASGELAEGEGLYEIVVGTGIEGIDDKVRLHIHRACNDTHIGCVAALFHLLHDAQT